VADLPGHRGSTDTRQVSERERGDGESVDVRERERRLAVQQKGKAARSEENCRSSSGEATVGAMQISNAMIAM